MKKAILQFLKKIKLARQLAAADLLPLLSRVRGFQLLRLLTASAVQKNTQPLSEKLNDWLNSQNNPFVIAFVDELSSRPDLIGREYIFIRGQENFSSSGALCFKIAGDSAERDFYSSLLTELATHPFPQLQSHLPLFNKQLDSLTDMRFYGSDLESLLDETSRFEEACPVNIDWAKTSSAELWLEAPAQAVLARKLSPAAQCNLLRLVTNLLLERQVFVSAFHGVLVDIEERVNLIDFDYLYPFDSQLLNFLQNYLCGQQAPSTHLQFKLVRLLRLLQIYCPEHQVNAELSTLVQGLSFPSPEDSGSQAEMLALYVRQGLVHQPETALLSPNPAALAFLLDKKRFVREPGFRKSSWPYYLPLLLVVFYLYLKYFH